MRILLTLLIAGISSSHGKEIFGVNYEKVLELKKRYDPTDIFNKSVKIF
jgi:hypothetical protein